MASSDHNLFFASRVENGIAYLDSEESRHAMSVLRFSEGDTIPVTDGKGAVYECKITTRETDTLSGAIASTKLVPRPHFAVRMFVGICDRDKFEELAENCAALGAEQLVPLVCRFCQKPWWNAWDKHAVRIWKKLVSGITQSRNPWLPLLAGPTELSGSLSAAGASFVIVAEAGGEQLFNMADKLKQATAVSCFVGPPGGFSPEELDALKNAGAAFVSLSANRLRTELAATVLCGAVKLALGDGA
jgi:16S rRNA (uracil1498-N3)-methyltransferase